MSRICKTCTCPCLFLTLRCIVDKSILTLDNGSDTIKGAMDAAQRLYIEPIIGSDCLTEICNAIALSELPDTDPSYTALSAEQEFFLKKVEPAMILATELIYYSRYGLSKLTAAGAKFQENWLEKYHEYQSNTIESNLDAELAYFKKWYENYCGNLDCYPCVDDTSTCKDDTIAVDLWWTTTSPYSF